MSSIGPGKQIFRVRDSFGTRLCQNMAAATQQHGFLLATGVVPGGTRCANGLVPGSTCRICWLRVQRLLCGESFSGIARTPWKKQRLADRFLENAANGDRPRVRHRQYLIPESLELTRLSQLRYVECQRLDGCFLMKSEGTWKAIFGSHLHLDMEQLTLSDAQASLSARVQFKAWQRKRTFGPFRIPGLIRLRASVLF